jgi:hypothetical protein
LILSLLWSNLGPTKMSRCALTSSHEAEIQPAQVSAKPRRVPLPRVWRAKSSD